MYHLSAGPEKVCGSGLQTTGFTMIELLVVVALLAILSLLIVPLVSTASDTQIEAAAQLIASDVEYVKSLAIGKGTDHSIIFDLTNDSYKAVDEDDATLTHPVFRKSYVTALQTEGMDVDIKDINGATTGTYKVTFDYIGTPYIQGLSTPATTDTVIELEAGTNTRYITIKPITGFAEITEP